MKSLAIYILPAAVVFIIFILMHNSLVQPPLSREEIVALINDKNEKEEHSEGQSDKEIAPDEKAEKQIQQSSDIPFIGPRHYYHSFTGALATDLKNDSGISNNRISRFNIYGKIECRSIF